MKITSVRVMNLARIGLDMQIQTVAVIGAGTMVQSYKFALRAAGKPIYSMHLKMV